MVTSSMELRAVSLDACAVEKDSWRRWSAAGQNRHQGAAADGGPPAVGCAAVEAHATAAVAAASRAVAAKDDDASPEAGGCGGYPTPRPAHRRRRGEVDPTCGAAVGFA